MKHFAESGRATQVAALMTLIVAGGLIDGCVLTAEIECAAGTALVCPYNGPPETEGVGLCRAGIARCTEDGTLGPCAGEVLPDAETCSTAGDDDCDGQVNEDGADCECKPGESESCYDGPPGTVGTGICRSGVRSCALDGKGFEPCLGQVLPSTVEDCATPEDDDCDGATACACEPGAVESCYPGPAGTEGVGSCVSGSRACDPDGSGWGACAGGVLPAIEECDTPADENCDGEAYCAGTYRWSARFGEDDEQLGLGLASDKHGNIALTGRALGSISFGGAEPMNATGYDGIVAKFDPGGNLLWSRVLGGAGNQWGQRAVVDSQGNVIVAGQMDAATDFGAPCPVVATPGSGYDVFVAKLAADDGHCIWAEGFGGPGLQWTTDVAIDGHDHVFIVGESAGNVKFGVEPEVVNAGGVDIFIAKLDSQGAVLWSKGIGDASNQTALGVAASAQGDLVVAGQFEGSVDFSGSSALQAAGAQDAFVVKLTDDGAHVWSRSFGGLGVDVAYGVAVESGGDVLITGRFQGQIDFGGTPFDSIGGSYDMFVVKLASSQGAHLWSRQFGDAQEQTGRRIHSDAANNVIVAGDFFGGLDFGTGPLQSAGAAMASSPSSTARAPTSGADGSAVQRANT